MARVRDGGSDETKLANLIVSMETVVRRFPEALYDWLVCGDEFCHFDLVFVHARAK
jgi:hypothetical protein